MPIRLKLLINFGLLFALALGTVTTTWFTLNHLQSQAQRIIDIYEPQVSRVSQVEMLMIRISLEARHAMLAADDPAELQATFQRIGQFREQKLNLLNEIDHNLSTPEGQEILASIRASDEVFWRLAGQTVGLIQSGNVPEAFALLKSDLVAARNRQLEHIEAQKNWQRQLMNQALSEAGQTAFKVKVALATVVALVLILIGFASLRLMRMMRGAFDRAQSVTQWIAGGQLDTHVYVREGDEFGSLFTSIVNMQERLSTVVGRVADASTHIVEAASTLDGTNRALKDATQGQLAAIDQSVAGTRSMVEAVVTAAQATDEVNRLVAQAGNVVSQSGEAVKQVVSEMQQIDDASRRIAEIVGVIDGIAFQTNILALNAAVEAARAGEQGRGFAVVAAEVRNLAQRSAQAAKEVKTLIDNSTQRVQRGSQAAGHAGETVQMVLTSVAELSQRMRDIAAATEQQRTTAGQMETSIQQAHQSAHDYAELVEASNRTATGLREEAHILDEAISAFNLDQAATTRLVPA
jgi:methyl-accepting chemotaxis protein